MIPNIISRVRMNQRTKRPPPHHKPAHKRAKLLRVEHVHLEHANRVRADGPLEHRVNAQFGELAADALVQLFGVLRLRGGGLLEVDVDVETATAFVGDGRGEGGVGRGSVGWGWVDVGFGIGAGGDPVAEWELEECFRALWFTKFRTLITVLRYRCLQEEKGRYRDLDRPLWNGMCWKGV